MSAFGQWYEEQKTQESAPAASSSWFGGTGENGEQVLPLFGDTSQYSFGNFRTSMEAQMPQKILGMNYQQRFRVRTIQRVCVRCRRTDLRNPLTHQLFVVRRCFAHCCFCRPSFSAWRLVSAYLSLPFVHKNLPYPSRLDRSFS